MQFSSFYIKLIYADYINYIMFYKVMIVEKTKMDNMHFERLSTTKLGRME